MCGDHDGMTAAHIAAFDQSHAEISGILDALVESYRDLLDTKGHRPEICLGGLAQALMRVDHSILAQVLAVAVERLVAVKR